MVIDLGTGDGRFVYRSARKNPDKFYIGIDANARPLERISERIYRRAAQGGAANALYLQAAVEDLPDELAGLADEVRITFPWGTLLKGLAAGDERILKNVRHLCKHGAILQVIIGIDPKRDASELKRLRLPELSQKYLEQDLLPRYDSSGFEIIECRKISSSLWPEIESTWAKRLSHSNTRVLIYLPARAK